MGHTAKVLHLAIPAMAWRVLRGVELFGFALSNAGPYGWVSVRVGALLLNMPHYVKRNITGSQISVTNILKV